MKEHIKEHIRGFVIFSVFWVSLVIIWFMIKGCIPMPPPIDPAIETNCKTACDNLKRLQCSGWEGSPGKDEIHGTDDDVPCWKACKDIESADPTADLKLQCTTNANSCEAVDNCFGEE